MKIIKKGLQLQENNNNKKNKTERKVGILEGQERRRETRIKNKGLRTRPRQKVKEDHGNQRGLSPSHSPRGRRL